MNQAAIEIARILLQFEVERIERQKTVAASEVSQAQDAATVSSQAVKATQRQKSTRRRVKQQVAVEYE